MRLPSLPSQFGLRLIQIIVASSSRRRLPCTIVDAAYRRQPLVQTRRSDYSRYIHSSCFENLCRLMPHFQTIILAASLIFTCALASRADLVVNMSPQTSINGLISGNGTKVYNSNEFGTHSLSDSSAFGSFSIAAIDSYQSTPSLEQIDIHWDPVITGDRTFILVRHRYTFDVLADAYLSLPVGDSIFELFVVRNRDFEGFMRLSEGESLTVRAGDHISATIDGEFNGIQGGGSFPARPISFRIQLTAVPEPSSAFATALLALSVVLRRKRETH